MKIVDTFQNRLKKAMELRNVKQVDLVEKTGLDKTLINKYLAGISNARQRKLTLIADALNINEIWLMGYDVPMDRDLNIENNNKFISSNDLNTKIKSTYGSSSVDLLDSYVQLNDIGQNKALENVQDLTKIPEYTEKKNKLQSSQ